MDDAERGEAYHCFWFFVNNANALAPISWALSGAFSTPPDALTCGPIYFIVSKITGSVPAMSTKSILRQADSIDQIVESLIDKRVEIEPFSHLVYHCLVFC